MTSETLNHADTYDAPPRMQRDEAYVTLERLIVTGRLEPGRWVSETDLMEISGHSRASVRSAVQRLQDQDLVSIVPRRGAQICPVDITQQFRAQELRRVVESFQARCAAQRANPAQRAEFAEIAEGFAEIAKRVDPIGMIDLDARHHSLMIEAADNAFAAKALVSVKGLSRRFWVLNYKTHGDIPRMALAHGAVADAIARGNPEDAAAAVHGVVDYVEEFTLKVVGYSGKPAQGAGPGNLA